MTKGKQKRLNARQRALIELMPDVEAGKITQQQAMLQAGYAEESSRQQKNVLDNLRNHTEMQKALAAAGVTTNKVAAKIAEGMDHESGTVQLGFTKLASELMDAFPAQKSIVAQGDIEDLIRAQEAK